MMNKYQQIKNYVDDHYKYYAFYPYDIVLNMDTENEETLSYDEYMAIYKSQCDSNQSGTEVVDSTSHCPIITV